MVDGVTLNFPSHRQCLETCYGRNAARAQMLAMNGSVEEVARICDDERIDAQFHKGECLLCHAHLTIYPCLALRSTDIRSWDSASIIVCAV